jgi:hypothetical protein
VQDPFAEPKPQSHRKDIIAPSQRALQGLTGLNLPTPKDDKHLRQLIPNLHKTPYTQRIRATIKAMRSRALPAAA